ncbi:hypothetical protein DFH06DRAFT_1129388 [Mycena polygramma]|nr:hypothetical protein DFH06DRAFT_1129388 [Mycena polygramma]
MSHITTALFGPFSRIFFPLTPAASDLGLSHSKSDPDLALAQQSDERLRPASSTSVPPRPVSAMSIEGYWGWDAGVEGTTLRRRTGRERDGGLKPPADVKITDSSPVLACQPSRPTRADAPLPLADVPADPAALADIVNTLTLERPDPNEMLIYLFHSPISLTESAGSKSFAHPAGPDQVDRESTWVLE